jgi:hypothetical protein
MEVKSELLVTQRLHLFENEYAQNLFGRQTGTAFGRILELADKIVMNKIEDVTDGLELFGVLMRNWGWHKRALFVYIFSHRSVLSIAFKSFF